MTMRQADNATLAVRQGRPFVVQCEHYTTPGRKDAASAIQVKAGIEQAGNCRGTHKVYDARTGQEVTE